MSETLSLAAVVNALGEALAAVCGDRLGPDATAAQSDASPSVGVTAALQVSGAVNGRAVIWFERTSAEACTRLVAKLDAKPDDAQVAQTMAALVADAVTAVSAQPQFAAVKFSTATISSGQPVAGAQSWFVAAPNVASCMFSVGIPAAVSLPIDDRLGVVLDVHLPLVVRFGRTVMPLRTVAELGPGSVINMGRSPEEPVELLVGERLIAHGEVVVVGGNYGVRITQLAAGRENQPADREVRMS